MKTYHDLKLKPTYDLEDTAEQFRKQQYKPEVYGSWEGWEPLEPLMLPSNCPWCKEGCMDITPYEVEERIEARIGAYRVARCEACGAQAITNARGAWNKKNKQLFIEEDYRKHGPLWKQQQRLEREEHERNQPVQVSLFAKQVLR